MLRTVLSATLTAGCLALMPSAALAATFTIVNLDSPGEGFRSQSPATPVGGNLGTTLGQQRLNAFQYAADVWGQVLDSDVEIRVDAQFDNLGCTAGQGVILGQAGSVAFFRDFVGAPLPSTWYHSALSDSLVGADLDPSGSDIFAQFNSDVGSAGCDIGWYYGFDRNPGSSQIDIVSVLIHEIGHGLGFATPMNAFFGSKFLGFDDAYMMNLENHCTGKTFPEMTDAERADASITPGGLHWTGSAVTDSAGDLGNGTHASCHVQMYSPAFFQGGSSVSHFSTALSPDDIMEPQYVRANHDVDRSVQVMIDIGWSTLAGPACGDITADGFVASTDAFGALQASVGNEACLPGVCDVNASSAITATDALLILRYAVGQSVRLTCGATSGACAGSTPNCSGITSTDDGNRRPNSDRPDVDRPYDGVGGRPVNPRPDTDRPGTTAGR